GGEPRPQFAERTAAAVAVEVRCVVTAWTEEHETDRGRVLGLFDGIGQAGNRRGHADAPHRPLARLHREPDRVESDRRYSLWPAGKSRAHAGRRLRAVATRSPRASRGR